MTPPRPQPTVRGRLVLAAAASLALGVAPIRAQGEEQPAAPSRIDFEDDPLTEPEFRYNDAQRFRAWVEDGTVVCEVEMREPLAEGMFTKLTLYLDTDDNPKTGMDGAEIQARASVGSRFHPNAYGDADGKAFELRHASWAHVTELEVPGQAETEKFWQNSWSLLDAPVVEGKVLRMRFPVATIRERGARYGSVVGIRPVVQTTCSEQPIAMEALCADDGLPIRVDGKGDEWSEARLVDDPVGELHPAAEFLDLTQLRVEHGPRSLFAQLRLATAGLRKATENIGMFRRDAVFLFVQPMHPRYQEPVLLEVPYGKASVRGKAGREGLAWNATVGDGIVEFEVERRAGQTLFRVVAWSDLVREDTIGVGGFLRLDWSKGS